MWDIPQIIDVPGAGALKIALIGPGEQRRKALAGALKGFEGVSVKEFPFFPADLNDLPKMLSHEPGL
jgi:hypothetical protein